MRGFAARGRQDVATESNEKRAGVAMDLRSINRVRVFLLWVLAAMLLGMSSSWAAAPEGHARLHFHRDDGNYDGWGLYVWGEAPAYPNSRDWGDPIPPTGTTSFGIYFDVPLQPDVHTLNFIIHKGDEKHIPSDQVLPLDDFSREVWIRSGDVTFYAREPGGVEKQDGWMLQVRLFIARQPASVWYGTVTVVLVMILGGMALFRAGRLRREVRMHHQMLEEARSELSRQAIAQQDIQARHQALAGFDELTGLLTRSGLKRVLDLSQAKARRGHGGLAVLFIDLDDFKPINDQFGHAAGDHVLKVVAARLSDSVRESDSVARLGGDEFVVIADELGDPLSAARLANKLVVSLTEVIMFEGQALRVAASLGIAFFPTDGEGDALVERADAAMYHAKHSGKNGFRFASSAFDALAERQAQSEKIWRQSLATASLVAAWEPAESVTGGPHWGMMVRPCSASGSGMRTPMPDLVAPDPSVALEADLVMLEQIAASAEAPALQGARWVFHPARGSLFDPRFLSACRGALTRISATRGELLLELDVINPEPNMLGELVKRGVRFGLNVTDPGFVKFEYLLADGLAFLRLSLQPRSTARYRALSALSAAARQLDVVVIGDIRDGEGSADARLFDYVMRA